MTSPLLFKSILAATLPFILLLSPVAFAKEGIVTLQTVGPDRRVAVEIADTPEARAKGLMFHSNLRDGEGMYFIFQVTEPQIFWMKNVPFPLDILFIGADGTIVAIAPNVPPCHREPCPLYHSVKPVRAALELPGGWCDKYGVRVGGKVEYRP
ncbi:MAG: DUF192 domain-containing protein [Nitrospinae bacterium]|nr:DUF192 domain-containing protein [Nitrospinota bacterium]